MAGKFYRNKAYSFTILLKVAKNFEQKSTRRMSCDEKIAKTSTRMSLTKQSIPDKQII